MNVLMCADMLAGICVQCVSVYSRCKQVQQAVSLAIGSYGGGEAY